MLDLNDTRIAAVYAIPGLINLRRIAPHLIAACVIDTIVHRLRQRSYVQVARCNDVKAPIVEIRNGEGHVLVDLMLQ